MLAWNKHFTHFYLLKHSAFHQGDTCKHSVGSTLPSGGITMRYILWVRKCDISSGLDWHYNEFCVTAQQFSAQTATQAFCVKRYLFYEHSFLCDTDTPGLALYYSAVSFEEKIDLSSGHFFLMLWSFPQMTFTEFSNNFFVKGVIEPTIFCVSARKTQITERITNWLVAGWHDVTMSSQ